MTKARAGAFMQCVLCSWGLFLWSGGVVEVIVWSTALCSRATQAEATHYLPTLFLLRDLSLLFLRQFILRDDRARRHHPSQDPQHALRRLQHPCHSLGEFSSVVSQDYVSSFDLYTRGCYAVKEPHIKGQGLVRDKQGSKWLSCTLPRASTSSLDSFSRASASRNLMSAKLPSSREGLRPWGPRT